MTTAFREETFTRMVHEVEGKYIAQYIYKNHNLGAGEPVRGSNHIAKEFKAEYEAKGCGLENKEYSFIALLTQANKIINIEKIGEGSLVGCVVDPAEVAKKAILANAKGIMLCHNHPSGSLKASEADINLTRKIKQGLELFDIRLLDHIILVPSEHLRYYSFADEGMMH